MTSIVVNVPEHIGREIESLGWDKSLFAIDAIEEKLSELKLERPKAFRKLLVNVFNRMMKNSKLGDADCLTLGKEVNEEAVKKYL